MHFHVKLVRDGARLPTSGVNSAGVLVDPHAAGFDLYAPDEGIIDPLSRKTIPLGIAAAFTEGYVALLMDRSGMGSKGIHRFAGVIDPGYRGEWGAVLYNSTPATFRFARGERIVQVVFLKVEKPEPVLVEVLDDTLRAGGGFGSTGK